MNAMQNSSQYNTARFAISSQFTLRLNVVCLTALGLLGGCSKYLQKDVGLGTPPPPYVHRGAQLMHDIAAACANQPRGCATANLTSSKVSCPTGMALADINTALKNDEPIQNLTQQVNCSYDTVPAVPAYKLQMGTTTLHIYQTTTSVSGTAGCRYVIYYDDVKNVDVPSASCD